MRQKNNKDRECQAITKVMNNKVAAIPKTMAISRADLGFWLGGLHMSDGNAQEAPIFIC